MALPVIAATAFASVTGSDLSYDDRGAFYWAHGGLADLASDVPIALIAVVLVAAAVSRFDAQWFPATVIVSLPWTWIAARIA